jgi:hypothetical protein
MTAGLLLQGCAVLEEALLPAASPLTAQVSVKPQVSKTSYRVSHTGPSEVSSSMPTPDSDLSGCDTNKDCLAQLKALVSNERRDWIGQPVPAAVFATGVRLFAYRALRPKLTCKQLELALGEIDVARRTIYNPIPGITPEQIDRVRVLNAQVEDELRTERANRCGV